MNKYIKILIMLATCLGVGYISSVATQTSVHTWFPTLIKPSFNPPNYLFMPVWTTLYVFMGVAAGLVWARIDFQREDVKKALLYFFIQLALNAGWSLLFFGLKNPFLALVEIVLLWLMIYETFYKFVRISKYAGWLFVPYILWVSFALILNASLWYLNT
ncbi:TspO/MBR family protein [Flavobacterium silvaticum]|uniref:Tryptophan-rich sensory protein n=1 Tax=Flavobacterium silvaticum TaxID=1852020 RepID=A0A972JIC2_9FLAO|nr:TspO/MBR family protein [Flavobacterium silvaticum]NMH27147.1 tryptophan-rich sensory protein [Flavobacterium silvaticum]